jgi:broad specificity phosphatase PhoE
MKKYHMVYKEWLADPYRGRIPRAETMQVFKKRVMGSMKKIIRLNRGKTVAVVCHGGVIGMFTSSILKSRNFWGYVPKAASVTVIKYKNGKFSVQGEKPWVR